MKVSKTFIEVLENVETKIVYGLVVVFRIDRLLIEEAIHIAMNSDVRDSHIDEGQAVLFSVQENCIVLTLLETNEGKVQKVPRNVQGLGYISFQG